MVVVAASGRDFSSRLGEGGSRVRPKNDCWTWKKTFSPYEGKQPLNVTGEEKARKFYLSCSRSGIEHAFTSCVSKTADPFWLLRVCR